MLMQRIVTGAALVAVVVGAVVALPGILAGLVLGLFWLLGVREWAGFARLERLGRIAYVVAFALLMWLVGRYGLGHSVMRVTLAVTLVWWLVAFYAVLTYPRRIPMGVVLAAGVPALLPAWWLFAYLHSAAPMGRRLLLAALVIVWAADIGAFLIGRWIGRVKLAPRVSPGKTWEGVFGGVGFAAVAGAIAGRLLGESALQFAALAIASAIASVIGDLTVSMFKRNVGLKDSGALLPGHGGVLDRVDSLTSAVAVFVAGLMLVGLLD